MVVYVFYMNCWSSSKMYATCIHSCNIVAAALKCQNICRAFYIYKQAKSCNVNNICIYWNCTHFNYVVTYHTHKHCSIICSTNYPSSTAWYLWDIYSLATAPRRGYRQVTFDQWNLTGTILQYTFCIHCNCFHYSCDRKNWTSFMA